MRPGLLLTREQQRLHDQMKKKNECKPIGIKALEVQRRQEGLETAIDSSNKGFSLLQKMGYKPGLGIGKNSKPHIATDILIYITVVNVILN